MPWLILLFFLKACCSCVQFLNGAKGWEESFFYIDVEPSFAYWPASEQHWCDYCLKLLFLDSCAGTSLTVRWSLDSAHHRVLRSMEEDRLQVWDTELSASSFRLLALKGQCCSDLSPWCHRMAICIIKVSLLGFLRVALGLQWADPVLARTGSTSRQRIIVISLSY